MSLFQNIVIILLLIVGAGLLSLTEIALAVARKVKLKILAESAKYDVSCSSSGTTRSNQKGGLGNAAGWGICHSFAEDGRCISLLKIMLTNHCIYDCA